MASTLLALLLSHYAVLTPWILPHAAVLRRDELLLLRQSISMGAAPASHLSQPLPPKCLLPAGKPQPRDDRLHQAVTLGQLRVAAKTYAPNAVVTTSGIHLKSLLPGHSSVEKNKTL